ncbi:UDP-2-acetamido-2-deoxy-3-oxo-D-glucuronate aminotransferase [Melaminivora sp.]
MQLIDLQTPYRQHQAAIHAAIERVLGHGQYILGPEVEQLEQRLADYTGAGHCISVANGTDALQIALMALQLTPGDEVLMPGFTYMACAEAALLLGARPVFVDIDPVSYHLDAALLQAAITPRTRAIMAVSLYGQCADFDAINAVAARHGLPVIEDAAQSFGASYRGRKSGHLSTIACTSFFPSKPLGCYGDGGAIFTSDPALAQAMRQIARHGQGQRYQHLRLGVNSRLDTLQAAVLLVKLDLLDAEIAARQQAAQRYAVLLDQARPGLELPQTLAQRSSAWAQYTLRLGPADAGAQRERLRQRLQAAGIPSAVHYPLPLYRQPACAAHAPAQPLAHCEAAARSVLSLPMSAAITEQQQQQVAAALRQA